MTGFRFGQSGSHTREAGKAFGALGKRRMGVMSAPVGASPACRVTAPRLWWKGAVKQVTRPRRRFTARKRRKSETGALLPWRLPRLLSAEEQMWADYEAFKAAGMLHVWLELYRDVLNLGFPPCQAVP